MKKAKKYLVMFMTMVFMLSVSQLVYAKEAGSARSERTLRLCVDEHTTISFSYQTKEFKCEVDNPEAELTIHKTTTSQTSSGGQYESSTTVEISFGTIGEYALTISDDNDELIVEYAVIISDHEWVDGVVVKEQTCTENGVIWSDKYTIEQEATCTQEGSKSIHCTVCGIVQEGSEKAIPKIDHDYGDWVVVSEATTSEEGIQKKTCKMCGHEVTQTISQIKGVWKSNSRGYWYEYPDGSYPKNCWKEIDGYWYYFNSSGYRVTGWIKINNIWYYLDKSSGIMQTGWIADKGVWYYLASSGAMQTGWIKDKGLWYYLNSSGAMQTGWIKVDNVWYYLNSNGAMRTGWLDDKGKKYYLSNSGAMVTGWKKIDEDWYYFNTSGAMVTSQWVGDYYLKADGTMAVNEWIGSYYVDGSGKKVPGKKR